MKNKQKATKLGIDYKNLTPEQLKEVIQAKELELKNAAPSVPPVAPGETLQNQTPKVSSEPVVEDANIAVIMNGKFEVRRYSLSIHGEDFVVLADEFANKKNYQIKFVKE